MYFIRNKIVLFVLFTFLGDLVYTQLDDENDTVAIAESCDDFCYGLPENMTDYNEIEDEKDDYEIISEDAKIVYPHLFNISYIKENTPNYEHLRVTLKEIPGKGIAVFANRPIKANRVLLYYQMKVFERSYYKPVSNGMYFFSIIDKYEDELSEELIGDLYEDSNPQPRGRIPFWGYLTNEPSGNQIDNAQANYNVEENYRDKEYLEPGDIIVYKIESIRDIEPGEEITWCYGESYIRHYKSNCFSN